MIPDGVVLELASKRRSIRKFMTTPVPLGDVFYAIKAALQAPSGANRQPWRFVVIGDSETKMRIREASEAWEKRFHESGSLPEWFRKWLRERNITWEKPFLSEAPYLIAVFSRRGEPYARESTWLAIGYLLLALEEKGLASLTYTPANPNVLAKMIGTPRNYMLETIIPVGLAGEDKKKENRLSLREAVFINEWGNQV
ncbi:MAG: nitroreductase family protein [Desulfurococcales archaeon]|nr:nitroreductase family protein [Desulfurococcales archaeon]